MHPGPEAGHNAFLDVRCSDRNSNRQACKITASMLSAALSLCATGHSSGLLCLHAEHHGWCALGLAAWRHRRRSSMRPQSREHPSGSVFWHSAEMCTECIRQSASILCIGVHMCKRVQALRVLQCHLLLHRIIARCWACQVHTACCGSAAFCSDDMVVNICMGLASRWNML